MSATVQLASLPDRENLVAEGWDAGTQVCEATYEDNKLTCYVFRTGKREEEVNAVLQAAVQRLRREYSIPPDLETEYVDVP